MSPMARAVGVLVRDDRLDKEIAEMLKLSPEGVRYHMRALRKKFACRSRVGVAVAVERVAHATKNSTLTETAN
jgi:DNA-binding CsgD family transcriptional regulator